MVLSTAVAVLFDDGSSGFDVSTLTAGVGRGRVAGAGGWGLGAEGWGGGVGGGRPVAALVTDG